MTYEVLNADNLYNFQTSIWRLCNKQLHRCYQVTQLHAQLWVTAGM